MRTIPKVAIAIFLFGNTYVANSEELASAPVNNLRLFNTEIFGRPTSEAIVLLEANKSDALDPETVMVDIDGNHYFAATVRYPKQVSFADARHGLNARYGKWESQTFADDPEMGIWRNEDDHFSMQLTEDDDNIVLIYIKYSLVTDEIAARSFGRAMRGLSQDELSELSGELGTRKIGEATSGPDKAE